MSSALAEKEALATRAFRGTFVLDCVRTPEGWAVWSALWTMRYQIGTVYTDVDVVVYRPSKPGIYKPPEYLTELALDVAKRVGLRILH